MSHIVVITHAYDQFRDRKFLLGSLAAHWIAAGHDVSVTNGLDDWPAAADLAILHVDLSLVPAAYVEASRRYPVVVNAGVTDIRKRQVSGALLQPDATWPGPVIVKTDLNSRGQPEVRVLDAFRRDGLEPDLPQSRLVSTLRAYPVLASLRDVPASVWRDEGLVVERFLPEPDPRGYATRAWVFFGDRERCTRYVSRDAIVKSADVIARETVEVPAALRAQRARLRFDYGKFDFVVVDGNAVLLDANRTPSAPPPGAQIDASNADLARGLSAWLRDAA